MIHRGPNQRQVVVDDETPVEKIAESRSPAITAVRRRVEPPRGFFVIYNANDWKQTMETT
jgi:hypothetical protein